MVFMISKESIINIIIIFIWVPNLTLLFCVHRKRYNFSMFYVRSMENEKKSLFKHPY